MNLVYHLRLAIFVQLSVKTHMIPIRLHFSRARPCASCEWLLCYTNINDTSVRMALPRSMGGLLLPRLAAQLHPTAAHPLASLTSVRGLVSEAVAADTEEDPITIEVRGMPLT